ncbi:MAG: single-stranded-DNA-specific exonuclease RecJ [Desulfuromonas sp.]|nr:single-stranded-DNA-specific exonuclease RecJ [Desulfuromonas sp.]
MQPSRGRRWLERTVTQTDISGWSEQLQLDELVCRLLTLRGVDSLASAEQYLSATLSSLPDPGLLRGVDVAVKRLSVAIANAERIAVHGDYDVDGISGTALLCQCLRWFGATVDYHIPLRMRDGYGLSAAALRQAAADGVAVVVSVDCGISAVNEAALAAELGLDLIITDHHQPPETLPSAVSCVNPWLPDCDYPDKRLSGVGVAFMVMIALRAQLRREGRLPSPEPDLRYVLDLVALGTVADLVPLQGVNRLLVQAGLRLLDQQPRPGVQALKQVADVNSVSAGVVGFKLAPRLNAAGRLEDAAMGVELLLSESAHEAQALAEQLNQFNRQRQSIEKEVFDQAVERIENELVDDALTIVLADERWHAGVIGIVASRLVECYQRPTVLIALDDGNGKGSARSIRGFHLYQAFDACSSLLRGFGGHEYAAGLTMDAVQLPAFAQQFEHYAQQHLTVDDLVTLRHYDAELPLQDIDRMLYDSLQAMAPYGMGNPEPLFVGRQVHIQQLAVIAEKHLRFTAQQDGYSMPCIAFGMAERMDELTGEVDLMFQLSLNCWRDRETLQLNIKDFAASGGTETAGS